jgi:hypothetical protein
VKDVRSNTKSAVASVPLPTVSVRPIQYSVSAVRVATVAKFKAKVEPWFAGPAASGSSESEIEPRRVAPLKARLFPVPVKLGLPALFGTRNTFTVPPSEGLRAFN